MASHFQLYSAHDQALRTTQISILLVVILTGIVSSLLVRSQLHHYEIHPDSIPIANIEPWDALRN